MNISISILLLRLVTGVLLRVVVLDFVGVDAVIDEIFYVSESESSRIGGFVNFLTTAAINLNSFSTSINLLLILS